MQRTIDLNTWNRKQHYDHFTKMSDPYFAITIPFNVTKAHQFSKKNEVSFFGKYLHDCMKAINSVENFKYRIENNKVVVHDVIHASATILRSDSTYGCSFIEFSTDLIEFIDNLNEEKERIENSTNLFPPQNGLDCIYCSAMPWFNFTGHKEPVTGFMESVPKLAFSKVVKQKNELMMNVAISANHALVDGYHVGLFAENFQHNLNIHKQLEIKTKS